MIRFFRWYKDLPEPVHGLIFMFFLICALGFAGEQDYQEALRAEAAHNEWAQEEKQ